MKLLKYVSCVVVAMALGACGGGNKATTTSQTTTTTTTTTTSEVPSSIEVLASSNALASAGAEVVITAFVKNASNVGLEGKTVDFATSSGILQVTSAVSDASGAVSAKLTAGSNKALRNITVTVSAASASGTIVIPVTETRVSVAGSGSLQLGGTSATYTVRAVDSASSPIAGAAISVSSSLGNAVVLSSPVTDATGVTTFTYTPSNAGTDTVTVSGLGLVATTTVLVSAIDFAVLSPIPASDGSVSIPVGLVGQSVTVRYKNLNVGVPGQTVTFSTTRGTFAPASSTTDANGDAAALLSSTTAGQATVLAQIAGVGQVSLPVQFVAGAPETVVVQANPGAVQPNLSGATSNQSTIEAVVRDSNLNAVANTQVTFSLVQDLSNGSLSPGVAQTDGNGRAQVQFISGASSTAANGVIIKAEAGSPVKSGQTTLTVNGQALFITLAFGSTMSELNSTNYSKPLSAYVTDANGVAVASQTLSLSAIPVDYDKGVMVYDSAKSLWGVNPSASCVNEDSNGNGILDAGEDDIGNGNGNNDKQLTPGNVTALSAGTVTTDASGLAFFDLRFGKPYAGWINVRITARAMVAGTESSRSITLILPALISDLGDETIPPAGQTSPFGKAAVCIDPS